MNYKELNVEDIPTEFIIGTLTPYQVELVQLRFAIVNKFWELRNKGEKWEDIYEIISEEFSISRASVVKIVIKCYKILK